MKKLLDLNDPKPSHWGIVLLETVSEIWFLEGFYRSMNQVKKQSFSHFQSLNTAKASTFCQDLEIFIQEILCLYYEFLSHLSIYILIKRLVYLFFLKKYRVPIFLLSSSIASLFVSCSLLIVCPLGI